jgi:beta-galactosidase
MKLERRRFIQMAGMGSGALLAGGPLYTFGNPVPPGRLENARIFLWGAQYYRAPTPEQEIWETDFRKMKELGFNHVKFWAQWRWSHIRENEFVFDDLIRLMELAGRYDLGVTINTIFDVSPHWLFERYPDAKQVMNNGHTVEPYVVGHRQIGGHPGPCYNHPGAQNERKRFLAATIHALKNFPALKMWDVWNEPELSFPQRYPIQEEKLVCYCTHCEEAFMAYLRLKYTELEELNEKWGRNYPDWKYVEMPRSGDAYLDFIDWREFHAETMTREAAWRLDMVREKDPERTSYLHVVPNTMAPFNAVTTCADDFAMAGLCDVFAATMHGGPFFTPQVTSAARGKVCYNVESHINAGSTSMHQKINDLEALKRDFVPQLGLGIKGFLFWQFRPEVLGREAPAWGLVNLDGSDREITRAARTFWETLSPYAGRLMESQPATPRIGIWKSRKNEIFQYCMHGTLDSLMENVNGYASTLYWNSYAYRFISGDMLARGELEGLSVLIMPSAYYLTTSEAYQLAGWVRRGGFLLAEAHLGGYNGTTGRHCRTMPGLGLAEAFGFREEVSTSSHYLDLEKSDVFTGETTDDILKALEESGISGSRYYPIRLPGGQLLWGAERYAELAGNNLKVEGTFQQGKPCAVSKAVGDGYVYYYGSRLGTGAAKENKGLHGVIGRVCQEAGTGPVLEATPEEANMLFCNMLEKQGQAEFIATQSRSGKTLSVTLAGEGSFRGLFSGITWSMDGPTTLDLPPDFTDLFVRQ